MNIGNTIVAESNSDTKDKVSEETNSFFDLQAKELGLTKDNN